MGTSAVLTGIEFPGGKQARALAKNSGQWCRDDGLFTETAKQLDEYFCGQRTEFSLEIDLTGTEFQKKVWAVLQTIPYGATVSYGEVARNIGQASASRAVGSANNANPLPIVVPCHRVIGADKSLTGFGGGLAIKRALLEMEYHFNVSSNPQGDLFYRA